MNNTIMKKKIFCLENLVGSKINVSLGAVNFSKHILSTVNNFVITMYETNNAKVLSRMHLFKIINIRIYHNFRENY